MKTTLVLFLSLSYTAFTSVQAQAIAEIKGIRFYEHHSTDMTGKGFGSDANGSKSGYDFVTREYVNSFDVNTFGPYMNGEEKNIDMVEHNGPFGTNGDSYYLGFTSGVSTIWGGDIKGNGTTKWHKVSANGVTKYDGLTNYTDLKSHYDSTMANVAVGEVKKDDVYIGRIRNTDLYVMIRCTNTMIIKGPPTGGDDNDYFDFDYKFGSKNGVTGVQDITQKSLQLFPNPTQGTLSVQLENTNIQATDIILFDMTGKQIEIPREELSMNASAIEINTHFLPAGLYRLRLQGSENTIYSNTFLKTN